MMKLIRKALQAQRRHAPHPSLGLAIVGLACLSAVEPAHADAPKAEAPADGTKLPRLETPWELDIDDEGEVTAREGDKAPVVIGVARPRPPAGGGSRKWMLPPDKLEDCQPPKVEIAEGPVDLDGDGSPEWLLTATRFELGICQRWMPNYEHVLVHRRGGRFGFARLTVEESVELMFQGGKPAIVVPGGGHRRTLVRFERGALRTTTVMHPALAAARKATAKKPLRACSEETSPPADSPEGWRWCREFDLGGSEEVEKLAGGSTGNGESWWCTAFSESDSPILQISGSRCEIAVLPTRSEGYAQLYAHTPIEEGVYGWTGSRYELLPW